jgi:hypothetical protein
VIVASVQIALIIILGVIAMMVIAAITRRGLEVSRSRIVFLPPTERDLRPKELSTIGEAHTRQDVTPKTPPAVQLDP